MKRRSVKVIKSRLEDIEVGDVVNRSPDAEIGWFTVEAITTLFNGHLQLADVTEQLTVSGDHKDMVGLQLVEEIELDERGMVAPIAPPIVAALPGQAVGPTPAGPIDADDHQPASPRPRVDPGSELEDEVAAAAEVATRMGGSTGGSHDPSGVNLALVAELLEDLDVGEAPRITESPDAPMATGRPVLPQGARPVYGDELPETPSYKNPVVVDEGTLLPRRSRAA